MRKKGVREKGRVVEEVRPKQGEEGRADGG